MQTNNKLKTRIIGLLLFVGFISIVMVVAGPVLYLLIMSGGGVSEYVVVMIPLAISLEWVLSSLMATSFFMMASE